VIAAELQEEGPIRSISWQGRVVETCPRIKRNSLSHADRLRFPWIYSVPAAANSEDRLTELSTIASGPCGNPEAQIGVGSRAKY